MDIQKLAMKSYSLTCERSKSARERKIALYKSDQQQQQQTNRQTKQSTRKRAAWEEAELNMGSKQTTAEGSSEADQTRLGAPKL